MSKEVSKSDLSIHENESIKNNYSDDYIPICVIEYNTIILKRIRY